MPRRANRHARCWVIAPRFPFDVIVRKFVDRVLLRAVGYVYRRPSRYGRGSGEGPYVGSFGSSHWYDLLSEHPNVRSRDRANARRAYRRHCRRSLHRDGIFRDDTLFFFARVLHARAADVTGGHGANWHGAGA